LYATLFVIYSLYNDVGIRHIYDQFRQGSAWYFVGFTRGCFAVESDWRVEPVVAGKRERIKPVVIFGQIGRGYETGHREVRLMPTQAFPNYQASADKWLFTVPLWYGPVVLIIAALIVTPPLRKDKICKCGYSLEGLQSDKCPECGRLIEQSHHA
jgi:hypothetical protein